MFGRILGWVALGSSLVVAQVASADSQGLDSRPAFGTGVISCGSAADGEAAGCHFTDANPQVMVSIDGPEQITALGQDGFGIYTVSMPPDTLGRLGAGMNAGIDAPNAAGCEIDEWNPIDKMQVINDDKEPSPDPVVSHFDTLEAPSPTLRGTWSYQFLVTNCTTPGTILLRAAMNAFDDTGDEEGEVWNSTTLEVAVPEPGATLLGVGAVLALAALGRSRRS